MKHKINLPEEVITRKLTFENKQGNKEDLTVHTIPCVGYEKLVGCFSANRSWVHKDCQVKPKKTKKSG